MPETAYALYVGIDWGTVTHQVAVLDAQRVLLGERAIALEAVALYTLTEWLTQLAGGAPARVAVALEVPRSAVVDTRLERGFASMSSRSTPSLSTASATATRSRAPKMIVGMRSYWPPPSRPTSQPSGRSSPRIPGSLSFASGRGWRMSCARNRDASPVGCASNSTGFICRRSPSVPPPRQVPASRSPLVNPVLLGRDVARVNALFRAYLAPIICAPVREAGRKFYRTTVAANQSEIIKSLG